MPPRRISAALPALALATMLLATDARAQYDVIETRDLRLLYPRATLGFIAPYTARCFENSMRFHKALWHYTPDAKINLILDDVGDYGNAGVWGSPRTGMVLHIAPSNFVYETGPANERVNFTMNHECTHVVALDMATGSDRFFRDVFHGKVHETSEHPETVLYDWLVLPRRSAPRWYHEGIAVFLETWMSGGLGRAQGPYDEMVFRSMVKDNAHFWDPLGLESEGTRVDFQIGVNSYLYGTRFMNYLAYTQSPEKVVDWVARRPGSKRAFQAQFLHEFGKPLSESWRDWVGFEHDWQRANLDSIRRYPITPSHDLSTIALGSVSRAFVDSAGKRLIAAVQYPGTVAHIAAVPLGGGAPQQLREVKGAALYFVSSLALDQAQRKLYYTTDNNDWRDLWVLDLPSGHAKQLQHDARIGDLAFDAADRSLWGVRHFNGISTVVRMDAPYRDYHGVWSLPYGQDIYDLDVSPDGTRIAASYAEVNGRQTLRLFRTDSLLAGDTASVVLHDFGNTIPQSFVFAPDGKRLYGSSYYTGVSNIWRCDLESGAVDLVTNTDTGFFRPIPGAGDSLIVFRYTGHGFRPAAIEARPIDDASAITFLGEQVVDHHPVLKTWKVPPPSSIDLDTVIVSRGPYRPMRQLGLAAMYPIVEGYKSYTAVGVRAEVSDPIGFHSFDASASVTPDERAPDDQLWHVSAGYRRYNMTARLRWNPASFYDLAGPFKTSRKGTNASLGWNRMLLNDAPRTIELAASLDGWTGLERLPDAQNVATSEGFEKLVSGEVRLTGKNMRASIGAVDYEKGAQWKLIGGVNDVRFSKPGGSDWKAFPNVVGTLDAGMPMPIRNASLWMRTAAGWAPGERDEPFANFFFGGFGNNWLDHQDPKRYRDYSSFPGLEIDEAAGTNFVRGLAELNLPPLRFSRLGGITFYAAWARLSLFATALGTNIDLPDAHNRIGDIGAQTDVRFQLLTLQPLTLSAGYARAYRSAGFAGDEWMISLKVL